MNKKDLGENVGWFLAFAGVSAFLVSLIHPKSRVVTKKMVSVGGVMAVDYAVSHYLPRFSQGLAKILAGNFTAGVKGGVAKKTRRFKKKIF